MKLSDILVNETLVLMSTKDNCTVYMHPEHPNEFIGYTIEAADKPVEWWENAPPRFDMHVDKLGSMMHRVCYSADDYVLLHVIPS